MKISNFSGRIIQVSESLSYGDGVSNQIVSIDRILKELGISSIIATQWVDPLVADRCTHIENITPTDRDIIIYHASGYSKYTASFAVNNNATKVMLYHNITPHSFFDKNSELYDFCKKGREQLAELVGKFTYFWGDSQYNVDELISLGADTRKCRVIPIVVPSPVDSPLKSKETGSWVFLGRVASNKGQADLVKAFAHANRVDPAAASKLYLVGGFDERDPYYLQLQEMVSKANVSELVHITGKVSNEAKEDYLARASVYVSFSSHEGFGIPLVEAPLRDTPVVAIGGSAIGETLGNTLGLTATKDDAIETAIRINKDQSFRRKVLEAQQQNATRFSWNNVRESLTEALSIILPRPDQYRTVSVVICTYNRRDLLERCLDYLAYQNNSNFEVIVVDGPSTDGTKEYLSNWANRIKIVHNPLRNLSASRNLGAEVAAGDIIAYIDDDAIPFSDWVSTLLEEFNSRPLTTAAVGGPAYYAGSLRFQSEDIGINRLAEAKLNIGADEVGPGKLHRSLLGTNTAFSRDHLNAIGAFDEQYDYFLDESDLTYRLQEAGALVVYSPQLHLRHEFAQSDNRKGKHSFNWFSIVKNTAYFVARFSGLKGRKLETYLKGRILQERVQPLNHAAEAGEIDVMTHAELVDQVWRGMAQGLEDSRRGPLTRTIGSQPNDFLRFATSTDFERVGVDLPRLHICIISKEFPDFGGTGGIGTLFYHLASELLLLGHEVTVLVPDASDRRYDQGRFHVRCVESPAMDFGDSPPATAKNISVSLAAAEAVINLHQERPIDIVECALWDAEGLATALIDKRCPPVVVRLVTPFAVAAEINAWNVPAAIAEDYVAAERSLIHHADAVVGISQSVVSSISGLYGIPPNENWSVSHCGVAYWPFFDFRENYGDISENPEIAEFVRQYRKIVLFVGRLERRKGVDTLLKAARTFLKQSDDVGLVLCGADIEGWSERSNEIIDGLQHRIFFAGAVSDALREKMLSRAYCLVFPSRYESFGLVPLEAFVHGTPVVAANAGAVPEVVSDGMSGLLFDAENPSDLSDKVCQLLQDGKLHAQLSRGAKAEVRRMSGRATAIRAVELYSKLIRRRSEQA